VRCEPILKHDEYVQQLYAQLKDNYTTVYRNIPLFSRRKRLIAEIDIIAVREDSVDVFEVKCSHRPVKAKRQLRKIRKLLGAETDRQVNTWFYCGEGAQLYKV